MPGVFAGRDNMQAYAKLVGAEYRFDQDQKYMGADAKFYDALRPVFDVHFHKYDRVLFLDLDVFAVDGLTANIFEEPVVGVGMCEEMGEAELRAARTSNIDGARDKHWAALAKELWGVIVPRDDKGRVRVFNAGVVLYTREAMINARQNWAPVPEYREAMRARQELKGFYTLDQPYLHAMTHLPGQTFTVIPPQWNRRVFGKEGYVYDRRADPTHFVHVQITCADHWDAATHHRIVNLPHKEWDLLPGFAEELRP